MPPDLGQRIAAVAERLGIVGPGRQELIEDGERLLARGGSLVGLNTADDPVKSVRKVLDALAGLT